MVFVNKIAAAAEAANHHPDILINYNKVTLTLVSHDSGGVTQRDIRMAGKDQRNRRCGSNCDQLIRHAPESTTTVRLALRFQRL